MQKDKPSYSVFDPITEIKLSKDVVLPLPKDPEYITVLIEDWEFERQSMFGEYSDVFCNEAERHGYLLANYSYAVNTLSDNLLKFLCPGIDVPEEASVEAMVNVIRKDIGKEAKRGAFFVRYDAGEEAFLVHIIDCKKPSELDIEFYRYLREIPRLKEEEPDDSIFYRDVNEEVGSVEDIQFSMVSEQTRTDEPDPNEDLIKAFVAQYKQLKKLGVTDEYLRCVLNYKRKLSRTVVSRGGRITLPDYGNAEVRMDALSKAVYLLFLKHPEGIRFKELVDYRRELLSFYMKVSNRSDIAALEASIDSLVNQDDNSINEKTSKANRAFRALIEPTAAEPYSIVGAKGELKSIPLDRSLVIWEMD